MKTKTNKVSCWAGSAFCAVTTLILVLMGACQARAGWRAVDAENSWADFQRAFQYTGQASYDLDFSTNYVSNGVHQMSFWQEAELIEMAEDAYEQNPTSANESEVEGLCDGFVANHGDNWSSDAFDDDLCWACVAFIRAHEITGTTRWLTDAENNVQTVWNRGWDSTFGGGIWWNSSDKNNGNPNAYKNSAANWTFVVAAGELYYLTSNSTYLSEAQADYNWCTNYNLCDPSQGEVFDNIGYNGQNPAEYTYNYGVAMGAGCVLLDESGLVGSEANWVVEGGAGFSEYLNGYFIMPNYGQGGHDGGGFNGILFRYMEDAYYSGQLASVNYLPWAQANISQAWAERNATGESWNNWEASTPAVGNLFAWDCSDTLCGMLDTVPTN